MMFSGYFKAPAALLLSISVILVAIDAQTATAQQAPQIQFGDCPKGIRPRREIRTLSTQERQAYIKAIKELQKGSRPSRFDEYAKIHDEARDYAHNYALFFPWHRYYLALYERDLQKSSPDTMLPYWDWSIDSQAPSASIIFRPDYFGGDGRDGDKCVTDGQFANMQIYYPRPGCLTRDFSESPSSMRAFYSPELLQGIITRAKSYNAFRQQLEMIPHGVVHMGIGGMMSTMHSPNDPIFFMHHGMIDKLWTQWQKAYPNLANTYNGPKENQRNGASPDDPIRPWNNVRVRQVLDTRALCYTYDELTPDDVSNNGNGEPGTDKPAQPATPPAEEQKPNNGQNSAKDKPEPPAKKVPKKEQAWRGKFKPIKGAGKKKSNKKNKQKGRQNKRHRRQQLERRQSYATADANTANENTYATAESSSTANADAYATSEIVDISPAVITTPEAVDTSPAVNTTISIPVEAVNTTTPATPARNTTILAANIPASSNDTEEEEKVISLTKIQMPAAIDERWIIMNKYDKETVRKYEAIYKQTIYDPINAIPGYVSPCALGNRADQLAQLLAAGHTSFEATGLTSNVAVPVEVPTNATSPEADPRKAAMELRKQTADIVEHSSYSTNGAINGKQDNPSPPSVYNAATVEQKLTAIIGDSKQAGVQNGSLLDLNKVVKENWTYEWKESLPYWSSNTTTTVTENGYETTTESHYESGYSSSESYSSSYEESYEY